MTKHKKAEWFCNENKLPDGSYINRTGNVCYIKNGKPHRDGLPAKEFANGDKHWYKDGILHREDGPAIEKVNGDKKWSVNGKWHREDGPAMEWASGGESWYVNDKLCSKESHEEELKIWKMNEAMR